MAKSWHVADVIQYHCGLPWLRAQATTDHLQMQADRLRWPQQDATADAWHVNTLTNQCAGGEHLDATYCQISQ
jgi:hypothetical protein